MFASCFSWLVTTAPHVTYEILTRSGETIIIDNPQKVPDTGQIEEFREPFVRLSFLVPSENIGDLMQMATERRGVYLRTEYLSPTRAIVCLLAFTVSVTALWTQTINPFLYFQF